MAGNTVKLHRVLRATPERVYKAFSTPTRWRNGCRPMASPARSTTWTPRSAARYKMSFTNFTTGKSHSFGGDYLEIVPNERLRYTDKFDDPNLPGRNGDDGDLKEVSVGTELKSCRNRNPRSDPGRGVLPRLAGIAEAAREAGRGGDSGRVKAVRRGVAYPI